MRSVGPQRGEVSQHSALARLAKPRVYD
jgi:hypothetical protein